MTPEQERTFREQGVLLLPRALSSKQVEPLKAYVLGELKRLKIWSSGKMLSAQIAGMPPFQQIARVAALLATNGLHSRLMNETTRAAIASLAGTTLTPSQSQFLISLPNQGEWSMDALNWHTDISHATLSGLPGIQVFALLDDVKPRGGGTLAIAGSHLPGHRDPATGAREIMRRHRQSERADRNEDLEAELRQKSLSIVEMSGRAGDVYLMDMRLLHTPSINSTKNLRMMATVRYLAAAA